MTNWITGVQRSLILGASESSVFTEADGRAVKDVTDVFVLNAGVIPGELTPIYVCKTPESEACLTKKIQRGLGNGVEKTHIGLLNIATDGKLRHVTVKASANLPWFLELLKKGADGFFSSGITTLAGSIIALLVGSNVTIWIFLAAITSTALGTLTYLSYLALS
ncbi:MAG: hypothetical protein LBI34_01030 [Puniceicoccales bacterium]|jgi:hypothetical protein|nr:hypothetical protein [Puniceicoccales bacterium]